MAVTIHDQTFEPGQSKLTPLVLCISRFAHHMSLAAVDPCRLGEKVQEK